mgnify:CR=1 FL=1
MALLSGAERAAATQNSFRSTLLIAALPLGVKPEEYDTRTTVNEEFAVLSSKVVKYLGDATIVARLSHWNVRGTCFFEAHLLFERIYNDLGDQMDSLVEQLRACNFNPDFDLFRGPGISMEQYDHMSLAGLVLDYVMALDGAIALFYAFCEKNKQDPRLVGIGNQMQAMSSVVLQDMYLLQSYLA